MRKLLLLIALGGFLLAFGWNVNEKYTGPKTRTTDLQWHPDILPGYEARYVDQGEAFDGPCRSTIVRRLADPRSRRGVLYIHGFNDYFFQKEMGDRYVDSGYHFYAVDLRRYGRSREPWQYPFNVRNLKEYFADIDSALSQMERDGITDITLCGHSTGGLTTAYYVADRGARCRVKRLVTNSPFLEWNFDATYRHFVIPLVSFAGSMLKETRIDQGHCDGYAYSLLRQYHGEWEYNTEWKMIYSPPVMTGWIRAIERGQEDLMDKADHITVPVLVMTSNRAIHGCDWTPAFQTGDAVLDPAMIRKRGARLGKNPQVSIIEDGLHDLILSEKTARDAAYDTIFAFIRSH